MNKTNKNIFTNEKNISTETLEKRRNVNKKILTFGCLPIVILFGIALLFGIFSGSSDSNKNKITAFDDPLKIGVDSVKTLIGKKVPYDKFNEWGTPKTLDGTNGKYWLAYLDAANISFVSNKKTDNVLFAGFKEQSAINYVNEILSKREELIKKQLSPWDGSHIQLTKLIKKAMNDPNSFEHDETVYWDQGDYLIVRTKYRGRNAFGGLVSNWIKAKTDIETGTVFEIIEQGE